jgi:hypothetical protein
MSKQPQAERGQATVEMALVLPILIWLLIGLVDIARVANAVLIMNHATREAVRLGITGASDSEIVERARATAPTLDLDRFTVTVSPMGYRAPGADLTISLQYDYKVLALMGIMGTDLSLSTQLIARVE